MRVLVVCSYVGCPWRVIVACDRGMLLRGVLVACAYARGVCSWRARVPVLVVFSWCVCSCSWCVLVVPP